MINNYWEILFEHHKYPCILTEKDTGIVLYYNKEYRKLFHLQEDVMGKNIFDIFPQGQYETEKPFPNWTIQDTFVSEAYNQKLNRRFNLRIKYLEQYNAIFCESIPTETDLEANSEFEKAMSSCMEIFSKPHDSALISFMELLCYFYNSERAYVYRINHDDDTINCVSQWCLDAKFRVTQEIGIKMDSKDVITWIEQGNKAGIVTGDIEDEEFDLDSPIAKMMFNLKIRNMTLCVVEDSNHHLMGVVGLSNRKDLKKYFDPRLIHTIAKFVTQDVNREVVDATIFQRHNRDALTGLYNRIAYGKKIDSIVENPPHSIGIISVNLNGLRHINENLGIAEGDSFIKKSAQQLTEGFGCEFFRLSGDEFIGIAMDIDENDFMKPVLSFYAKKKVEDNYDFSIGHAWGKGRYDVFKLIQEADTLMYINKQEYYSSSKRSFDSVNDATLSDLLSFLENDEFMVYLQPQVRLKDSSLHGAEALIRRYDKKHQKMVFPDQFIPLYEQKSVIRHVDIFVIETVCALLQQWGKVGKAIPISVNLSRVTLQEFGIVETVVSICDKYQVPHHLLVIEVTERVGLIENNVASSLITAFKDYGFNISLDDFGCAYSNIVTLAQIEVDEVKIDKSLVDDLTTSKKNHILVKNVLTMCNELDGASTLAEGIEDQQQANLLHELGCSLGQGYFYSRPISVDDFVARYFDEI